MDKKGNKNGPKTLKSLSDTRWSCRVDALNSVISNFSIIIDTLEDISEKDSIHGSDASALLSSMSNFEFIFCIVFLNDVMQVTNTLSKYLQSSNINFDNVCTMTQQTIDVLKNCRSDSTFNTTWEKAMKIARTNYISSPKLPRKRTVPQKLGGGQINCSNTQSIKDIYKINIYFVILDIIIQEIQNRF